MTKFEWFIVGVIGLILAVTFEIALSDSGRYVKYDCQLVGISPDIPEVVKQECRRKK